MTRLQADMMIIKEEKVAKNTQKMPKVVKRFQKLQNVAKRCQEMPQVDKGQDHKMT